MTSPHAFAPGRAEALRAAPIEVAVGPLPFRPLHLLPTFAFGAVALCVGFFVAAGALRGLVEEVSLACTRTGNVIACDERVSPGGGVRQRLSGPVDSVRLHRLGGRYPEDCVEIGQRLACGDRAAENVARIRALAPGGSVVVDNTKSPSIVALVVGALFFLVVAAMAVASFVRVLGRGRRYVVRVGDRALEVVAPGGKTTVVPRVPGEVLRAAPLHRSRGSMPVWCIAYGHAHNESVLVKFMSFRGSDELAPAVASLQAALGTRVERR